MKYLEQLNEINAKVSELKKTERIFSILRLVTFVGIIVFLILASAYKSPFAIISLVCLVAFIVIVTKHNKHESKLKVLLNKINVIKNYEFRQNNQFQNFANNGSRYLEEEKAYLSDLDVFGDSSLFQLINICETKMGQDNLADRLKTRDARYLKDANKIVELKDKLEFSIEFQANNYGYSKDTSKVGLEVTLDELKKAPKLNVILDIGLMFFILAITIVSFIVSIVQDEFGYFFAVIIFNLLVGFGYSFFRKESFKSIRDITQSLSPLASNFLLLSKQTFKNEDLNKTINVIKQGNDSIVSIKKIDTLVSMQQNFFGNIITSLFLPFNMYVFYKYCKFHSNHYQLLEESIFEYTNLEALLSLAIIPQIKENTCKPRKLENFEIKFEDLKHPLIKESVCVGNSLSVKNGVNIITGSNMSGKTSFLRTIGINLVMMYAGGLTCGKSFESDYINIYSSMRITDDIKNGISTFYRELLTIKSAITDAKNNVKSLILIDEVFRGTNSNDRITGAISLINHLKLDNVILFMTTHDFELCKVEDTNNYHFAEHYIDDKIAFDYKLKVGQCTTTNAIYLMKLAGIIDENQAA